VLHTAAYCRVTELAARIELALPSSDPYRQSFMAARVPGREAAVSRGAVCLAEPLVVSVW
jgi:hypothetical protein